MDRGRPDSGQWRVSRDPFFAVTPETARFELDGEILGGIRRAVFIFHKPKGVVTTRSDEKGRATVFSLVDPLLKSRGLSSSVVGHLHAVGRLDLATTGLLLLTNDSRLSAELTDPANAIPRVYVVTVKGEVSESECARMREGIEDEGEFLRADEITLRKSSGKESHLMVCLREGKNREIRRLFLATGHEVIRLKRVAFGALESATSRWASCASSRPKNSCGFAAVYRKAEGNDET